MFNKNLLQKASSDQDPWIEDSKLRLQIPDKVIDCCQDREENKYTVFITEIKNKGKGNPQYGVHVLYDYKLYDITE